MIYLNKEIEVIYRGEEMVTFVSDSPSMKTFTGQEILQQNLDSTCFGQLEPGELDLVRESKTQVLFHRGESLTKQGAFGSSVLFVMSGLAKQYVEEGSQRNYNLRIVQPGEFIGLSAAFQHNKYDYSVSALRQTMACLIEREAITGLIRQNGRFAFALMKRYSDQHSFMYAAVRRIIYKQMHGRLADTLLYLDSFRPANDDIFSLLSRKELADFAGLSTESTVKLLKTFEKEELIRLDDKDILVLNPEGLHQISRTG